MFKFLKKQKSSGKPKVIVTGGAGFIGSHVADLLTKENFEVHVIDNLSSGKRENLPQKAILHVVDIRHLNELMKTFKRIGVVECVFHLAALPEVETSKKYPFKAGEINVTGTNNVLFSSYKSGAKKIVFSSSCAVYGNQEILPIDETAPIVPISPYAFHKQICESYMKIFSQTLKLPTISLRYFNVYGPRQQSKSEYSGVISLFLKKFKNKEPLTITGDGLQTRDFVHVYDVAKANLLAMKNSTNSDGDVFNIGSGINSTILSIANNIGGKVKYVSARDELRHSKANINKAKKILAWEPSIDIKTGLEEMRG